MLYNHNNKQVNISQIREFTKFASILDLKINSKKEKYNWISSVLNRLNILA